MLSPKICVKVVRTVTAVTALFLIVAVLGISTNFFVLRLGITLGLLMLAAFSFVLGYKRLGVAGIALGLLFNPFISVHLPRYIWAIIDIATLGGIVYSSYWQTDSYKKGTRFEQYVATLFPEPEAIIMNRTRDISKFSNRLVVSDMHPDFVFKNKKTGRTFAVECKWRGQWAKGNSGELGLWWNKEQGLRYAEYEKSFGIPVSVAFGIGGTPEKPKEIYFLELARLQYTFLKQSLVRSGKSAPEI